MEERRKIKMTWLTNFLSMFRKKEKISFYEQLSLVAKAAGSDPDELLSTAAINSEKLNNEATAELNESTKAAEAAEAEYARELQAIQEKRNAALARAGEKEKAAKSKAKQAAKVAKAISIFKKG